jgi:hypothetical protein
MPLFNNLMDRSETRNFKQSPQKVGEPGRETSMYLLFMTKQDIKTLAILVLWMRRTYSGMRGGAVITTTGLKKYFLAEFSQRNKVAIKLDIISLSLLCWAFCSEQTWSLIGW